MWITLLYDRGSLWHTVGCRHRFTVKTSVEILWKTTCKMWTTLKLLGTPHSYPQPFHIVIHRISTVYVAPDPWSGSKSGITLLVRCQYCPHG